MTGQLFPAREDIQVKLLHLVRKIKVTQGHERIQTHVRRSVGSPVLQRTALHVQKNKFVGISKKRTNIYINGKQVH